MTSRADIKLSQKLDGVDSAVLCEVVDSLPDQLSDLLEMSVEDAKAVEATPGYGLNMGVWVAAGYYPDDPACMACMAGSVMLRRIGVNPISRGKAIHLDGLYARSARRLEAINMMRQGHVPIGTQYRGRYGSGFTPRGVALNSLLQPIRDAYDHITKRAPWEVYLEVAKSMRAAGF